MNDLAERLLHAQIAVAELISFISVDNVGVSDHWAHQYTATIRPVIEFASMEMPKMTLIDHIAKAFGVEAK